MALTITHAKTNQITDWTQADLDAQIALGNYPPGTVLADIALPSDWNANHNVTGTLAASNVDGLTASRALVSSAGGVVSASAVTGTELGYVGGVTSAIQTQLDAKQVQLNGTGFVKASGTTITYDNSTYLTTSSAASTYVPYTGATSAVDLGSNAFSTSGLATLTGGLQTAATAGNSNLAVSGISAGQGIVNLTGASLQLAGATNTGARVYSRGSTNTTLTVGASYATWLIGATTATEAASGTHLLLSQMALRPLAVTNGTAATQDAATLYIEGPATGITPSGLNVALWVDSGNVKFDGNLTVDGTTTLASSLSGLLKATSGVVSTATSGTDYAPATSGSSILYGNGSGGFSNVTVGSGLSFAAGTLSATGGGTGDVVGPASATDNAVARFDTTTGKLIQNSVVIIDDSGNTSGMGTLGCGAITGSSTITGTAFIPSSSTIPTNGMYLPAANTLGWGINSAAEMRLTSTALSPAANDGNALGTTALMWSDLFLASGGVINWNNGNATLTHSTGLLTFNVPVTLGTSNAFTCGTIELGAATDTTISRSSAGVIAVEGVVVPTISSANTLTNKRITPRVQSVVSSATVTPNADSDDEVVITAQATGLTLAAPSGTPTQGQAMVIRILDNGGAQTITFNAIYRPIGTTLPTTTVAGKLTYITMIYNSTSTKWDVLAVAQEA